MGVGDERGGFGTGALEMEAWPLCREDRVPTLFYAYSRFNRIFTDLGIYDSPVEHPTLDVLRDLIYAWVYDAPSLVYDVAR